MTGIHPKWAVLLGAVVTVEQLIAKGTISFTNIISAAYIPGVQEASNDLAIVGGVIMTAMAAMSSSDPGPLTPKQ